MKLLQDLVPGCNKVSMFLISHLFESVNTSKFLYFLCKIIGKALVLDEIINYIQSLQRQVEVNIYAYVPLLSLVLSHKTCL